MFKYGYPCVISPFNSQLNYGKANNKCENNDFTENIINWKPSFTEPELIKHDEICKNEMNKDN